MITKPTGILFLHLLFSSCCLGQKALLDQVESADASKYKPFTIEMEAKKKYASSTHFKYIEVIDARADKSKLGIARAGEKVEDRKFVFSKNFTSYVEERLNKLSDPNEEASDTAVFIINNLWLYQTLSPGSFLKQQALGVSNNWNSNCFLNMDCYTVKNSRYHLIANVDTTITTRGWLPNQCSHILAETFSSAIWFSDSMFINKFYPATNLTDKEFKERIQKKFDHPILTADKLSNGIFNTYDDFLQNKIYPASIEVYYQKNKRCIKSKTIPDSVLAKSWGFSDGDNLYINVNGGFYKLIRSENTFDLIGPRIIEYKNSFFNKAFLVASSSSYGAWSTVDLIPLLEPTHVTIESFKLYQLNISDGIFR